MKRGEPASVTTSYRFAPIPEALLYDSTVDHLAVRVYGALARHGMDPASCYPSHRRLAQLVGVSPRSVQRPLKVLEEAGWISRTERFSDRGDRLSDGYHVHVTPNTERAGGASGDAPPAFRNAGPPALSDADPPRSAARTPRVPERGQEREPEEREQGNESKHNEFPSPDGDDALKPTESDPVKRRAHQLAVLAFEQDRKPVTRGGFAAVMARIEDALRSGRGVNELTGAITDGSIEVWTLDGISAALARRRGPKNGASRNLNALGRAMERQG